MLDKKILSILACPQCRGKLIYNKNKLTCKKCRLGFSVMRGIPNMVIEEAERY